MLLNIVKLITLLPGSSYFSKKHYRNLTIPFLSLKNLTFCLLESSFFGKWISEKYFPMFGSVMENKLENTF
jgi:hypothetical protein